MFLRGEIVIVRFEKLLGSRMHVQEHLWQPPGAVVAVGDVRVVLEDALLSQGDAG